jgi:CheY-like chemotaxis protein
MSIHRDILLVEDETAIADMLCRLLVRAGYTVRVAVDGSQALEALGEERPTVLILDLALPHVSGFTVMEHMHQQQMTLPIIVITANPLYLDSLPPSAQSSVPHLPSKGSPYRTGMSGNFPFCFAYGRVQRPSCQQKAPNPAFTGIVLALTLSTTALLTH